MDAGFYQTPEEISKAIQENSVPFGIGNNSTIDCVIVDKKCCIGNGVKISNTKKIEETMLNHSQYVIRDGIPIIVKGAVLRNGWRLA